MSPTTLENFNIQMRLRAGRHRRFAARRRRLHRGAEDHPRRCRRQERRPEAGRQDRRRRRRHERPDRRHRGHEAQRRREEDPRQARHGRPAGSRTRTTARGRKTIAITRDRIELKDSEARSEVIERGKKPDGTPYRIGVIQLPSFYMDMDGARLGLPDYKSTTRDVRRLLEEFKPRTSTRSWSISAGTAAAR